MLCGRERHAVVADLMVQVILKPIFLVGAIGGAVGFQPQVAHAVGAAKLACEGCGLIICPSCDGPLPESYLIDPPW
jgi:hypothetical protein